MTIYNIIANPVPIVAQSYVYDVAGANSFIVPYYRTITIEMWGGGGGGGTAYNGGYGCEGGTGGSYAKYTVPAGILTPGTNEYLIVGSAGLGAQGSGGSRQTAGGHTQFGNTIGVTGGKGGSGQLYTGKSANTFTATNIRSGFTLVTSENGGAGGVNAGSGVSVTYAGGGGGGMVNDYGQGQGGTSTFGGAGGNGGDGCSENAPRNGFSPGGGGGGTDWDGGCPAGDGGVGKIVITVT